MFYLKNCIRHLSQRQSTRLTIKYTSNGQAHEQRPTTPRTATKHTETTTKHTRCTIFSLARCFSLGFWCTIIVARSRRRGIHCSCLVHRVAPCFAVETTRSCYDSLGLPKCAIDNINPSTIQCTNAHHVLRELIQRHLQLPPALFHHREDLHPSIHPFIHPFIHAFIHGISTQVHSPMHPPHGIGVSMHSSSPCIRSGIHPWHQCIRAFVHGKQTSQ